ncbi:MAG: tRNA (adenosine(37)-N6)-threonylcarbamoyltransferase complex ATPase subunit type 1 TsaE [Cyanobacteria bacterium SIG30]|nr:tRNA (adenosine(37)-N6)-threonylcarbamoyltransferase complex ATPase subunit type 1 TsaE [Cyanobacteria bacterium SIG30]
MDVICQDLNKTKEIATLLAQCVGKDGAFIALSGAIGVGKTTFTRFLLQALGVEQNVTSPTFVLLNEYHSDKHIPIYHFDLYRLEKEGLKTISKELDEYIEDGKLTLIEWANYGQNYLPEERISLEITYGTHTKNENLRIFKFSANGKKMEEIVEKLQKKIIQREKELERLC